MENLVYLHLRRKYKKIFYFKEKSECEFIVFDKEKAINVVQVCYKIEATNFDREYNGLLEAMKFFKLTQGMIITSEQ